MTRESCIADAVRRLHRDLGELADRFPTVAARTGNEAGTLLDPTLKAVSEAVARLVGAAEFGFRRTGAAVLERTREYLNDAVAAFVPACGVVEFTTPAGGRTVRVPRHSVVRLDRGRECLFLTGYDTSVSPWRVTDVSYAAGPPAGLPFDRAVRAHLVVTLTAPTVVRPPRRLRLYSATPDPLTNALLDAAFTRRRGVYVSSDGKRWTPTTLRPIGFSPAGLLFPGRGRPSRQTLFEVFAFPRKHSFLAVSGLELPTTNELRILLPFTAEAPALRSLTASDLRTNCTPVVNLFPHAARPVVLTVDANVYPVQPDARFGERAEVYSVDAVAHVSRHGRADCPRQYSETAGTAPLAWHAGRVGADGSVGGVCLDVVRTGKVNAGDRLDVTTTCSNGDSAAKVQPNEAVVLDGPDALAGKFIDRPLPPLRPPAEGREEVPLFADAGPTRLTTASDPAAALRTAVRPFALCGWTGDTRPAAAARAVASIHRVQVGRGRYQLTLGEGGSWAFATALARFVRADAGIGTPPRVEVAYQAEGTE